MDNKTNTVESNINIHFTFTPFSCIIQTFNWAQLVKLDQKTVHDYTFTIYSFTYFVNLYIYSPPQLNNPFVYGLTLVVKT